MCLWSKWGWGKMIILNLYVLESDEILWPLIICSLLSVLWSSWFWCFKLCQVILRAQSLMKLMMMAVIRHIQQRTNFTRWRYIWCWWGFWKEQYFGYKKIISFLKNIYPWWHKLNAPVVSWEMSKVVRIMAIFADW